MIINAISLNTTVPNNGIAFQESINSSTSIVDRVNSAVKKTAALIIATSAIASPPLGADSFSSLNTANISYTLDFSNSYSSHENSDTNKIKQLLSKVYKLDENANAYSTAASILLIDYIEDNFGAGEIKKNDELLFIADYNKLHIQSLFALVISTYRFKSKLENWKTAYQRSAERMNNLGEDPIALFVGIDNT